MYWGPLRGIQSGDGDICLSCWEFAGGDTVCFRPLGLMLNQLVEGGMRLIVFYCPFYVPRSAEEAKT